MSSNILGRIVESKRAEIERLLPRRAELRAAAESAEAPRAFEAALGGGASVALLAEIKRRSPSAGWIRPDAGVEELAASYAAAGAAALSVLTDAEWFGGGLEDLRAARRAAALPVLRKDFILDPVQVWEARAVSADAVLLIVRLLDDARLAELHALARELGMAVLVEVHEAAELERALAVGAAVVGVNSRDLATFRTDLSRAVSLAARVPPDRVMVAESGIRDASDVNRLAAAGVDAVLVGESLMRAPDVRAAAAALVGRARAREARRNGPAPGQGTVSWT